MSSQDEHLATYHAKRDFTRTPEPARSENLDDKQSFVIQQHAARRMHWDVRFRVDDVMPSWAVPKGPSYDPKQRRLAMQTEDHPLDYQNFEGVIPKGEYGAGRVIVWDRGTYENVTHHDGALVDMRDAITNGHFAVIINGHKLQGEWTFTKMSSSEEPNAWMMIKKRDDTADATRDIVTEAPKSVISDHTIETIGESDAEWTRGRATWIPPMLATTVEMLPESNDEWLFEPAVTGTRCVAVRNKDEVELSSEHHESLNEKFPEVIEAIARIPVENFTLDGIASTNGYYVFDLVHLLEQPTVEVPLVQRKALLAKLLTNVEPPLHFVEPIEEPDSNAVAKRQQSLYKSGPSPDWLIANVSDR